MMRNSPKLIYDSYTQIPPNAGKCISIYQLNVVLLLLQLFCENYYHYNYYYYNYFILIMISFISKKVLFAYHSLE